MIILYDFCYWLFYWMRRMRKRYKRLPKIFYSFNEYYGLFLNRIVTPWLEKHPAKRGLNRRQRDERYTVSLTSFPARINHVHIVIEMLMRQKFKPDHIVLWLAESQFPDKKLPDRLVDLQSRGLTVRFCDDLRSHKKYFYAFQEYPEDNIILVDDDIFLSRRMLRDLVREHKKRKKDIISTVAQPIAPSVSHLPSVWPAARYNQKFYSTFAVQAFSGQGTLYPAHWYPQEIFQKEKAMSLAGSADDMWLQAMSYLSGVKTTMLYPHRGFPPQICIENNVNLYQMNNNDGGNMNDQIWLALLKEYKFDELGIDEYCREIV